MTMENLREGLGKSRGEGRIVTDGGVGGGGGGGGLYQGSKIGKGGG